MVMVSYILVSHYPTLYLISIIRILYPRAPRAYRVGRARHVTPLGVFLLFVWYDVGSAAMWSTLGLDIVYIYLSIS